MDEWAKTWNLLTKRCFFPPEMKFLSLLPQNFSFAPTHLPSFLTLSLSLFFAIQRVKVGPNKR
jgi:hypothetical protein